MKKICKYALVSSIILATSFVIVAFGNLKLTALPSWLYEALTYIRILLLGILFGWLFKVSVSGSQIKKPAFIVCLGYVLALVFNLNSRVITNLVFEGGHGDLSTLAISSVLLSYISDLLIIVGLVWLAKFFTKGSIQQIATYALAVSVLITVINVLVYTPLSIVIGETAILVIDNFLLYGGAAFFMFEFSKLKK